MKKEEFDGIQKAAPRRGAPERHRPGLVNKYYDLARIGDDMARGHYENLTVHADACVQCGHCERRCPFHVEQMRRMREIRDYFEKE